MRVRLQHGVRAWGLVAQVRHHPHRSCRTGQGRNFGPFSTGSRLARTTLVAALAARAAFATFAPAFATLTRALATALAARRAVLTLFGQRAVGNRLRLRRDAFRTCAGFGLTTLTRAGTLATAFATAFTSFATALAPFAGCARLTRLARFTGFATFAALTALLTSFTTALFAVALPRPFRCAGLLAFGALGGDTVTTRFTVAAAPFTAAAALAFAIATAPAFASAFTTATAASIATALRAAVGTAFTPLFLPGLYRRRCRRRFRRGR